MGSDATHRTALIAGAGIGGLTAALCLQRRGWRVRVVERAAELREVGAGIQLSPNAMRVMDALGLREALEADGAVRPEAITLKLGDSGKTLLRAPLSDTRFGAPYFHVHRADLLKVLTSAVEANDPKAIRLGSELNGFTQSEGEVSVELPDGTRIPGEILVGADGLRSRVREELFGDGSARYSGCVAWRATVPVDRLGDLAPPPESCVWLGERAHAVTYLLRNRTLANFVGVVEAPKGGAEESWSATGAREQAFADFTGWHPTLWKIISEADELHRWALFDRRPLNAWHDGRVGLIGDAAHPMLPFLAQGAAMAIEDGWTLSASLGISATVEEAWSHFRAVRFARTRKMQEASRANEKLFHASTRSRRFLRWGPIWAAGRIAPSLGLAKFGWIYSHDPTALGDSDPLAMGFA